MSRFVCRHTHVSQLQKNLQNACIITDKVLKLQQQQPVGCVSALMLLLPCQCNSFCCYHQANMGPQPCQLNKP